MAVNCDECGELFGIKNYEKERPGSDIIEHRFDCPHCKHSYLSYLTTEEIRENQKRQSTLRRHMRAFKGRGAKQKAFDEIQALTKENEKLMDQLKDRDGEWVKA